jgi:hypothetical protein
MKKKKKFEFNKVINISNLEKKPTKGGTPAIEKSTTVITDKKKKLNLKSANEYIVFIFELTHCFKVQKIKRSDIL